MTDLSPHQQSHPGCPVPWPWLEGCDRWDTDGKLLERARAELRGSSARDMAPIRAHLAKHGAFIRSDMKEGSRSDFIAKVEGEDDEGFGHTCSAHQRLAARLGWDEYELAWETADAWNNSRRWAAATVLFAYDALPG